jgi:trehalose 6-phosphate phosphatase
VTPSPSTDNDQRPASDAVPLLDPERHALFLDFDGTFVDFAPSPEAVRPRSGSIELLGALQSRLGGALAVISGRKLADIDGFLQTLELPGSGVHGQEFRPAAGDLRVQPPSPDLQTARDRLNAVLGPEDPLRLEDKGGALVLHFRQHPEQRDRAAALAADAVRELRDVFAIEGHAIWEIRQLGVSKAGALRRLAEVTPFAGRLPVFIGDDSTDEDGFEAAAELGGFGIKVGPGATAARYRLADVGAVHDWLRGAAGLKSG